MTEVILFPDIEQLLTTWLKAQLAAQGLPVPVGTRVPNPRPSRFVRIMRTGGPVGSVFVLDNPTIVVEAWGSNETAAAWLMTVTRGLINSLDGQTIGGSMIYRVEELAGPGNLPDPDSGQSRYTYTAALLVRGSAPSVTA